MSLKIDFPLKLIRGYTYLVQFTEIHCGDTFLLDIDTCIYFKCALELCLLYLPVAFTVEH